MLVERTSRAARLTAAGEVLLHDGRAALDAVTAAARRAQRAGADSPRLILAMKPAGDGGLLPQILAEYESQPDALLVEIAFSIGERAAMLRDGRADAALLHSPQNDPTGLHNEELLTQPPGLLAAPRRCPTRPPPARRSREQRDPPPGPPARVGRRAIMGGGALGTDTPFLPTVLHARSRLPAPHPPFCAADRRCRRCASWGADLG